MNNEEFENNHLDDLFKNVLKEEKKETMDWEFADFLSQVEPIQERKKIVWFASKKWMSIAAAATLILTIGIWSIIEINNQKPQHLAEFKDLDIEKRNKEEDTKPETIEEPVVLVAKNTEVQRVVKATQGNTKKTKETAYDPEYVIINGEPVYDLELAKQMTLQSLGLFTENVEKSVTNMEHIKHLSIKF